MKRPPLSQECIEARIVLRVAQLRELAAWTACEYWRQRKGGDAYGRAGRRKVTRRPAPTPRSGRRQRLVSERNLIPRPPSVGFDLYMRDLWAALHMRDVAHNDLALGRPLEAPMQDAMGVSAG